MVKRITKVGKYRIEKPSKTGPWLVSKFTRPSGKTIQGKRFSGYWSVKSTHSTKKSAVSYARKKRWVKTIQLLKVLDITEVVEDVKRKKDKTFLNQI